MGLDYSFDLIFKRQEVWKLLVGVADLSSPANKLTSIFFPDHTLELPFEAWAGTPEQLFFDDLPDQLEFMTCLDFEPDEALIDYAARYDNEPEERAGGRVAVSIGIVYLTVYNESKVWGGGSESDLMVLRFAAATSNMSILFCESDSIRAAMIQLLEKYEGVYGILDQEVSAELIWWRGRELSVELPHAYLNQTEIEELLPPTEEAEEESGSSISFCIRCQKEFEPTNPDEILCPDCRGETQIEPEPASPLEVAYCIIHGGPFIPSSPDEVICPECSLKEGTAPPPAGRRTELEPQPQAKPVPSRETPTEWQPGIVLLDTYTVSGPLGEGGMGKVYRVHHNSWNIDLALKSPKGFKTRQQQEDFVSEAEIWVTLGLHPHIVTCYYVRNIDNVPRVFAELVEGGSLADWIVQGKITTVEQALDLAIQFAWGLAYAHEQGLVHRDVKPANVLITTDGTAKVTDFGLVRAARGMTPAYASPEQADAQLRPLELTVHSDMWSWGLSILEIFAGRAFWDRPEMPDYAWGQVAPQALEHYLSGEIENTSIAKMPTALANLLSQCFRAKPSERPDSMDQVAQQLIEIYTDETGRDYPRPQPEQVELRADSLNNKALSLLDIGKEAQAEACLRETLEINPQHAEAIYNYNLIRWRRGEISDVEMVEILQGSIRNQPEAWKPWHFLALVHQEREDQDKTAEILAHIKELGKDGADPEKEAALSSFQASKDSWLKLMCKSDAHNDPVISVVITPDGKVGISSAGHPGYVTKGDSTIRLWDMSNLQPLGVLKGHDGNVNALAVLPDSQRLLSGGADGTLRLWDLQKRTCQAVMHEHEGSVICLTISTDGNFGFSGGDDGRVGIWDLRHGQFQRFLPAQKSKIVSIAACDDNRTLAVGYGSDFLDRQEGARLSGARWIPISLWDFRSAQCLHTFEPLWDERSKTSALTFLPGSRLLVSAGNRFRTALLQIWNIDTHQLIKEFDGYELYVNVLAINRNGDWLLAGSLTESSPLKIWDGRTYQCLRTFKRDLGGLDLNGDQLTQLGIVGGVGRGDIAKLLTASIGEIQSAVFSPETNRLLIGNMDGSLNLWQFNPQPVRAPFSVCLPRKVEVASAEVRRARGLIAQASQDIHRGRIKEALASIKEARQIVGYERDPQALDLMRRAAARAQIAKLNGAWQAGVIRLEKAGDINCISFSPDGKWLACGSRNRRVFLVDLTRYQAEADIQVFDEVVEMRFSQDGNSLGVASYRSGFFAFFEEFSLKTSKLMKKSRLGESHKDVVFSQDFKWAINLVYDNQNPMEFWDLDREQIERTFGYHEEDVNRLELFPEETRVITASGPEHSFSPQPVSDSLRIWEISTGKLLATLSTPTHRVPRALAVSPNGRLALSGGYSDYQIYCWDLDLDELKWSSPYHQEQVACLAFHPSGKFAASGANDRKIAIWRMEDGQRLFTLEGHNQDVSDVVFSPDGHWLASGAGDDAVLVWYLDWELTVPAPQDWDEGARDFLKIFLTLHKPYAPDGITRTGKPSWAEDDFQQLLHSLACAGYGWLRPDGVRRKLEAMAKEKD